MKNKINSLLIILFYLIIIIILYFVSIENYLLFHSIVELFGIVVVCAIFVLAWNLRNRISNNYILFLGNAYLFVAVLGILHMLAYKGMNIFRDYPGANLATQLWIATGYMGSITLLIAPYFVNKRIRQSYVLIVYSVITSFIITSIFFWNIFPECFNESTGLTDFKIYSEYIISFIFLLSIFLLFKKRKYFDKKVLNMIICLIIFKILSGLSFTRYISIYGFFNFTGHIFAMMSYYFTYSALISTALRNPFDLIFKDLEDKNKQYIHELEFIKTVIDIANVLVVVLDSKGHILLFNRTCQQMTGYVLEEIKAKPFWDYFIKQDELDGVKAVFSNLRSGNFPNQHENYWIMKDGSTRFISWSNTALLDQNNEFSYIVSVGLDITDITNLQRENKNIVSMIAHDMKSPLLSVQLFSNQLIKKWKNLDKATINEYLGIIHNEGDKLNTLIDEFLEFSLMRHGLISLEFKPVNPHNIINELYSIYSIKARQHNIKINNDIIFNKEIIGDSSRLTRVLTNLLDNAIKFSKENSTIFIRAHNENNVFKIEIEDTGIGIAEDELPNIFNPFIRGKEASKTGGYGVGLAYVKTVVEKHNGSISVKSKLGEGTTFTILLPATE